jgi:hypothetical protein
LFGARTWRQRDGDKRLAGRRDTADRPCTPHRATRFTPEEEEIGAAFTGASAMPIGQDAKPAPDDIRRPGLLFAQEHISFQ